MGYDCFDKCAVRVIKFGPSYIKPLSIAIEALVHLVDYRSNLASAIDA